MIDVGCAIILRKPRLLIAQRKPGDSLAGFWEFPGGKWESGESLGRCLAREVFEELGVVVQPRKIYKERIHEYPGKKLRLFFVLCDWIRGEPVKLDCFNFKWVLPSEMYRHPFIPADLDMIRELNLNKQMLFRPF